MEYFSSAVYLSNLNPLLRFCVLAAMKNPSPSSLPLDRNSKREKNVRSRSHGPIVLIILPPYLFVYTKRKPLIRCSYHTDH